MLEHHGGAAAVLSQDSTVGQFTKLARHNLPGCGLNQVIQ
jgi:hypothetical protein